MGSKLAIDGGEPVRKTPLPYARQDLDESDIQAVVEVLRSDWLTTGPAVARFEEALASRVGANHAVAVSSGTAALHTAMDMVGIGPGDEVIVPAITFVATANCVLYQGGRPVFADVEGDTLLIDVADVEKKITPKTKAVIAVDYAGQPCDYDALRGLCDARGLKLVADGAHSLGATYKGRPVGSLADVTTFSFHPVKHITSGEGGAVTTDDAKMAARAASFRNHGIDKDHRAREAGQTWAYDAAFLGNNYRITDFQCALALNQLKRLDRGVERRREIAKRYTSRMGKGGLPEPLASRGDRTHARHLFVVQTSGRDALFAALVAEGIRTAVHYRPVYRHGVYADHVATCPVADRVSDRILSLPLFSGMQDGDVDDVLTALEKVSPLARG